VHLFGFIVRTVNTLRRLLHTYILKHPQPGLNVMYQGRQRPEKNSTSKR